MSNDAKPQEIRIDPYDNLHPDILAYVAARDLNCVRDLSGYALLCIANRLNVPMYSANVGE